LVLWPSTKYIVRGKVVASPKFELWWVLSVRVCMWLMCVPKCSNYALTNLLFKVSKWVVRGHFLDIYILRNFQLNKKFLNPMGFDPYNHFLKIQKSIGTSTPKMGAHLEVWRFIPSHSLTLSGAWNVIFRLPSWTSPLQAVVLVVSPRLRL
jgi:hypothetical protein